MARDTIETGFLDGLYTPIEPVKSKQAVKQKHKITVMVDNELVERLKNAVYWSPGKSVSGVMEEALQIAVDQLEKQNGKPFAERNSELKKGRKLS